MQQVSKYLEQINETNPFTRFEKEILDSLEVFLTRVANGEFISTNNWMYLSNLNKKIHIKNCCNSLDLRNGSLYDLFGNVYKDVIIPLSAIKQRLFTAQIEEVKKNNRQQKFRENLNRLREIKDKSDTIQRSKNLTDFTKSEYECL